MDDNIKLLNNIYKNVESGKTSLTKIIPKVKNEDFKSTLAKQSFQYDQFFLSCEETFQKETCKKNANFCNELSNNISNMNDMSKSDNIMGKNKFNNIALDISLMLNSRSKNLADILIKENTSSIREITKSIVEYQGASSEVKDLASKLLNVERNNIEELQKYM